MDAVKTKNLFQMSETRDVKTLVSVNLVVHNDSKYLGEAIESVISQTFKDFELVIIDDGSTDETPKIIKSFSDKRIKLFRIPHLGQTKARNKAISKSSSPYIAIIDADDIWKKNKLEEQIEFIKNNPEIDVLGTKAKIIDANGNEIGFIDTPLTDSEIKKTLSERNCFVHPSVLVKRKSIIQAGLYRPQFISSQDYDLWLRIMDKGGKFSVINKYLVYYRIHPNSISISNKRKQKYFAELAKLCHKARLSKEKEPLDIVNGFLPSTPKKSKALYYLALSGLNLKNKSYREAKKNAILAILRNPFLLKAWAVFIISVLPSQQKNKIISKIYKR